jgi:DNA-3-methyladenine glycosylase
MFGGPGIAYVYLVYGMYDCLNVVTEPAGRPAAVLIRAVEPLEGLAAMRASRLAVAGRRRARRDPTALEAEAARLDAVGDHRLASGPGLVAAAFGLDRAHNGTDLCARTSQVRLEPRPGGEPAPRVIATARIGVGYAGEPWASLPWRLVDTDSASLSIPIRVG